MVSLLKSVGKLMGKLQALKGAEKQAYEFCL